MDLVQIWHSGGAQKSAISKDALFQAESAQKNSRITQDRWGGLSSTRGKGSGSSGLRTIRSTIAVSPVYLLSHTRLANLPEPGST